MRKLLKTLKILLLVFISIPLILIILLVVLVRFTDLTYSDKGKAILGYNEENKNWVINDWEMRHLDGLDGPYILKKKDQKELIYVIKENNSYTIKMEEIKKISNKKFVCRVENIDKDSFEFKLHENYIEQSSYYEMPEKLIAISDIEGNFNGLYSFLFANKVIDKNMNWVFGDGHLVLLGDFMDRGKNVTQVLRLIYKLEHEAIQFGGKVHFILGNHEVMNLQGQTRNINYKYISIAQKITKIKHHRESYLSFFNSTELSNWLKSKNIITQIGENIFVHGGISPELLIQKVTIEEINKDSKNSFISNCYDDFIFGRLGTLWYRGLVKDYKDYYKKIDERNIDNILTQYRANRIIVGHTIVKDISTDFKGKVIRIDVKHGKDKNTGMTKGILIQNNIIYKINDLGVKIKL